VLGARTPCGVLTTAHYSSIQLPAAPCSSLNRITAHLEGLCPALEGAVLPRPHGAGNSGLRHASRRSTPRGEVGGGTVCWAWVGLGWVGVAVGVGGSKLCDFEPSRQKPKKGQRERGEDWAGLGEAWERTSGGEEMPSGKEQRRTLQGHEREK